MSGRRCLGWAQLGRDVAVRSHASSPWTAQERYRVLPAEREPARRILAHLWLPPDLPPLARARDPTDLDNVEPSGQLGLSLA